jgi:hypothetical protein
VKVVLSRASLASGKAHSAILRMTRKSHPKL